MYNHAGNTRSVCASVERIELDRIRSHELPAAQMLKWRSNRNQAFRGVEIGGAVEIEDETGS